MFIYKIETYIDITCSNAPRDSSDWLLKGQQDNFNTLIQTIGLRTNVDWDTDPILLNDKWHWTFFVEQPDIFLLDGNPVGLLQNDLHNVPIISNLTNKKEINPAVFRTQDSKINTWISNQPS